VAESVTAQERGVDASAIAVARAVLWDSFRCCARRFGHTNQQVDARWVAQLAEVPLLRGGGRPLHAPRHHARVPGYARQRLTGTLSCVLMRPEHTHAHRVRAEPACTQQGRVWPVAPRLRVQRLPQAQRRRGMHAARSCAHAYSHFSGCSPRRLAQECVLVNSILQGRGRVEAGGLVEHCHLRGSFHIERHVRAAIAAAAVSPCMGHRRNAAVSGVRTLAGLHVRQETVFQEQQLSVEAGACVAPRCPPPPPPLRRQARPTTAAAPPPCAVATSEFAHVLRPHHHYEDDMGDINEGVSAPPRAVPQRRLTDAAQSRRAPYVFTLYGLRDPIKEPYARSERPGTHGGRQRVSPCIPQRQGHVHAHAVEALLRALQRLACRNLAPQVRARAAPRCAVQAEAALDLIHPARAGPRRTATCGTRASSPFSRVGTAAPRTLACLLTCLGRRPAGRARRGRRAVDAAHGRAAVHQHPAVLASGHPRELRCVTRQMHGADLCVLGPPGRPEDILALSDPEADFAWRRSVAFQLDLRAVEQVLLQRRNQSLLGLVRRWADNKCGATPVEEAHALTAGCAALRRRDKLQLLHRLDRVAESADLGACPTREGRANPERPPQTSSRARSASSATCFLRTRALRTSHGG
jgi:hypothetical protein